LTKLGEIEVLRLLPKHVFQLVRCDPPKWIPRSPKAPCPAIRWSVTSLASRGHGSGDRGPDTKRRLEGRPPSRRARQRVDLEQSPRGLTRALQF